MVGEATSVNIVEGIYLLKCEFSNYTNATCCAAYLLEFIMYIVIITQGFCSYSGKERQTQTISSKLNFIAVVPVNSV